MTDGPTPPPEPPRPPADAPADEPSPPAAAAGTPAGPGRPRGVVVAAALGIAAVVAAVLVVDPGAPTTPSVAAPSTPTPTPMPSASPSPSDRATADPTPSPDDPRPTPSPGDEAPALTDGDRRRPDTAACVGQAVAEEPYASDVPAPDAVGPIAADVEALRGLSFPAAPTVEFLDDDAISARLEEYLLESYPDTDAEVDRLVLSSLGIVERDTDLRALLADLLVVGVGGFYDPETGELVVRSAGEGVGLLGSITIAHELDHALVDSTLGLFDVTDESYDEDGDALLAATAVVEGDATLLEQQWGRSRFTTPQQQVTLVDPAMFEQLTAVAYPSFPRFIVRELLFPYDAGFALVCERHAEGDGWAAVDDLYDAPPTTTAEVLYPGHPGLVATPELPAPPAGFDVVHVDTFGAAPLSWLWLEVGIDASTAAWGGGRVQLSTDGSGASVLHLALTDREGADGPLCDGLRAWTDVATLPAGAVTDVTCVGATATLTVTVP